MKKIIFLLLTFLPLTLSAKEYSGTTGDCTWHLNTDTGLMTISGNGNMGDYDNVGRPWDNLESYIKTLVIENGVCNIGYNAFCYCTHLTSISLSSSVLSIGYGAFEYCYNLTDVTIPSKVIRIGANAFINCDSLTTINIPSSVTEIGGSAFMYCDKLTNVNISSGVTKIGSTAFAYCPSLNSINIPSSVTTIERAMFASCSSLTSIEIPSSVTTIEDQVFVWCTSLASVTSFIVNPPYNDEFFYNISSDCILYIPAGTRDAYIAAGWTEEVFKGGIVEMEGDDEDPAVAAGLCPDSNHPHIIDMGEAGKWSCCNVGASAPWEYGGYYTWGETEEKDYYSWDTYIHCDGSEDTCHDLGSNIAGTQYDVAHVKWGENWCMPSHDQQELLRNNCSSEWTSFNGINGRIFTASNGKTIFLPSAGSRTNDYNPSLDSYGCYLSSTQYPYFSHMAYGFYFYSDNTDWSYYYFCSGLSVRPVISESAPADPAVAAGLCPDSNHPHIIDMGEAGKWSCCNVGASAPWEYGGYYAWGETEEKDNYSWENYIHCDGSYETCHDLSSDIARTEYDVAHVKWGGNWCMPNNEQLTILHYKCAVETTSVNGINGQKITAPNGGMIFIPASGYRYGELTKDVGIDVNFWSSTQNTGFSYYAYFFNFSSEATLSSSCGRLQGHPVRPIFSESEVEPEDPAVAAGLCPDSNHPHIIDMGEVGKWACCNVGASAPWEYGGYYAWGETEEKDNYDWSTYIHCDGSAETCHDLGEDIAGTEYDVAHVKWGGSWCMPNYEQQWLLRNYCTSEWISINGIIGSKYTATNGGTIFLPAAGYLWENNSFNVTSRGDYWSSTYNEYLSRIAEQLYFNEDGPIYNAWTNRSGGLSVRPIISEKTENEPYLLLSHEEDGVTYKLYKKNNLNYTHVNADGWTFYKSDLILEVTTNGDTQSYIVSDDLYLCEGEGQPLCMALDYNTRTIHIFSNSKSDGGSYTMYGYYFVSPLDNISFTTEYVFYHNWGWMPYFTYTDGKLELQHFSFDDYYAMTSSKNDSGEWLTESIESIDPSDFEARSKEHGPVLVIELMKLSAEDEMVYTDEDPTLSIKLDSWKDLIMAEFYMHLPDGIEIATTNEVDYDVTLNTERVSDHVLEIVKNSEGAYHFFCYSPTNTPITGTTGELISVNLVHNDNVSAGTYPAQLTSILFSDRNLKGISQEPVTVNIQFLPFMLGDANDDTRLNGLDLTEIVNNIMERPSEQFVKHAVDFDKNDMVNSLDQREELDLLLSQLESDGGNAHETGNGTAGISAHFSTAFETVNPLSKAATLSISLENDDDLIMADFYLHLPDGIEIVTDDEGGYDVSLNSNRTNDHVVEIRKNSDGAYHFICYSPTNSPFIGTEGELMTVNFAYDKREIVGVYDGKLSGILFSDTNLVGVYADDVPFSMEYVDYLMGDVNADLKINAIDVVEMVDNIMERPSVIFVKRAGDFDNNDIINGLDLVAEVNLVLAQMVDDYVKARRLPSFGLEQADNLMRLKVEGESVVMGIDSSDQFILAQYTLHLSDGQTLRDITSDADHVVAYLPVGDNRYTVLCYSMRNNPFITNDKMMTIHVDGEGTVSVTDAMFVNTDRQPCWVGTANTEISTGIIEISDSFCQPVDIYSLNGMVVRKNAVSAEGLDKGIYIINGKKYMKR